VRISEKRKKWLRKRKILNCLFLSGAILVIATLFEIAQIVVTSNLPMIEKTLYVLFMWLFLAGFILLSGLMSPELMETIFGMLGFKEKADKNNEDKA